MFMFKLKDFVCCGLFYLLTDLNYLMLILILWIELDYQAVFIKKDSLIFISLANKPQLFPCCYQLVLSHL